MSSAHLACRAWKTFWKAFFDSFFWTSVGPSCVALPRPREDGEEDCREDAADIGRNWVQNGPPVHPLAWKQMGKSPQRVTPNKTRNDFGKLLRMTSASSCGTPSCTETDRGEATGRTPDSDAHGSRKLLWRTLSYRNRWGGGHKRSPEKDA